LNIIKAVKNMLAKPYGYMTNLGYQRYSVNYNTFLKDAYDNPFFYACIKEIVDDFNSVDIKIYRQLGDKVEESKGHIVQKWLDDPNPQLTRSQFNEYFITWLIIGGGLLLNKTKGSMTKYLNIYSPDSFEIKKDTGMNISGYKIGSTVIQGNEMKYYRCVTTVNPCDDIAGYGTEFRSRIKSAAKPGDLTNFAFNHMNSQLSNSGKRVGILSYKKFLNPQAKEEAKRSFESMGSGTYGAGRIAMLNGENFDFKQLDLTPQELDWLNSMTLMREIICSTLGVPVQLISSVGSTYNNISEMKKKIYQDTIVPLLKEYCEQMTAFLKDELGENHYIWYDLSSIKELQEDNTDSAQKTVALLNGIATKNEIRAILSEKYGFNLPKMSGEWYDKTYVSSSEISLESAGEVIDPTEGSGIDGEE